MEVLRGYMAPLSLVQEPELDLEVIISKPSFLHDLQLRGVVRDVIQPWALVPHL